MICILCMICMTLDVVRGRRYVPPALYTQRERYKAVNRRDRHERCDKPDMYDRHDRYEMHDRHDMHDLGEYSHKSSERHAGRPLLEHLMCKTQRSMFLFPFQSPRRSKIVVLVSNGHTKWQLGTQKKCNTPCHTLVTQLRHTLSHNCHIPRQSPECNGHELFL